MTTSTIDDAKATRSILGTLASHNPGRFAGFLYLLLVVVGPLRLIYIPTTLFVSGNATATAANITTHEWLFRLGIASDVFCAVILIFLVMAFYDLFRRVDRNLAGLVVIFGGVMPALIYFVNAVSDSGALLVARGSAFLNVFDKPQRDAIAMLLLKLHDQQITAAETLWGIWLLPLALLVYKSRFLPRFLAVWLAINGCAYIIVSATGLLFPEHQGFVFSITTPARLGELALMLWLLIKGAKPPRLDPLQA